MQLNPLMGTLKPQSNRPIYVNMVIRTLDGLLHLYSEEGPGWAAALPSPLLAVSNVITHRSTDSIPTLYYSMLHYNCICTLKG